jgi:hypothetical protein
MLIQNAITTVTMKIRLPATANQLANFSPSVLFLKTKHIKTYPAIGMM